MSWYEKIFKGLELLLLFTHHSAFIMMCWAENIEKFLWIPEAMKYCGLIVIFTIFIGGILDIIGFMLNMLIKFVKFIIYIKSKFFTKKPSKKQKNPGAATKS
jgi:hypothetical protein